MAAGATISRRAPGERHHVRLHGAAEIRPGEYTLVDGATVRREPTLVRCPYCDGYLVHLETSGALRVTQQLEPPANGVQAVIAARVPAQLRVLKCDPCEALFSGPRVEAGA